MSYLTNQDVANFGPELVDLTQRSAMHTVAPHLQALEQQNADLHAQLMRTTKRTIDQELDREVPNWREINNDPRWLQWLSLPDPYMTLMQPAAP